jgi:CheY-like chemotaxis protein
MGNTQKRWRVSYAYIGPLVPSDLQPHFDEPDQGSHGSREEAATSSGAQAPFILMIEDNPADVALVREALSEHGVKCNLVVLTDGEKAIQHIQRIERSLEACPALILLDLNLPRRHGRDILGVLRLSRICAATPVVVLSSSAATADIQEAAALGATRYICKSLDLDEVMSIGATLKSLLYPASGRPD